MGDVQKVKFYPRYCFHLSPTWPVWCFFKAADLHRLDKHDGFEGEQFYFYNNLPIKWVRIVGLVVAIDDIAGRRIFTVDDSSGVCLEVLETLAAPSKPQLDLSTGAASTSPDSPSLCPTAKISAYPEIDVGHVVEVKGALTEFRDERQINIEKMLLVRSTMEEVILWEKRSKFRREILDQPWVLSEREQRKAQKEAERDQAKAEMKKTQAQAVQERERGRRHPKTARSDGARLTEERPSHQRREHPIVQQPVNLRELLRENKGKLGALGL